MLKIRTKANSQSLPRIKFQTFINPKIRSLCEQAMTKKITQKRITYGDKHFIQINAKFSLRNKHRTIFLLYKVYEHLLPRVKILAASAAYLLIHQHNIVQLYV